ncbi:hypothetical protein NLN80_08940 [Citrobacter portucalensis]|uniref:DUF3226 domain-containing protein n=1 Tax=Citrobacter portucalensis TaxID=1639133 RepID=UPI00226B8FE2|nr:DUF3226 domain-containing protein [Citrobacter portucalensis]MCX9006747.1 hypothetical protein [Citrobacter portucalensis]
MENIKSTLIFCEGPHDVALICLVLSKFFNAQEFSGKFNELPSPYNSMYQKALENHAQLDLSLEMAHKFFLPDRIFTIDDTYVSVFNSGGKNRGDKINGFIKNLWVMTENSNTFNVSDRGSISSHKYIFIYDADHNSKETILNEIYTDFSLIGTSSWLTENWEAYPEEPLSIYTQNGEVAAIIWCNRDTGKGTLEDVLCECIGDDELFSSAKETIQRLHEWGLNSDNEQRKIAETAKMYKATLSLMGQRKKPGGSVNVIISQSKILNQDNLAKSTTISKMVTFLNGFI